MLVQALLSCSVVWHEVIFFRTASPWRCTRQWRRRRYGGNPRLRSHLYDQSNGRKGIKNLFTRASLLSYPRVVMNQVLQLCGSLIVFSIAFRQRAPAVDAFRAFLVSKCQDCAEPSAAAKFMDHMTKSKVGLLLNERSSLPPAIAAPVLEALMYVIKTHFVCLPRSAPSQTPLLCHPLRFFFPPFFLSSLLIPWMLCYMTNFKQKHCSDFSDNANHSFLFQFSVFLLFSWSLWTLSVLLCWCRQSRCWNNYRFLNRTVFKC